MYYSLTASLLTGNEYNQNKNHSSLHVVRGNKWAQGERGGGGTGHRSQSVYKAIKGE